MLTVWQSVAATQGVADVVAIHLSVSLSTDFITQILLLAWEADAALRHMVACPADGGLSVAWRLL